MKNFNRKKIFNKKQNFFYYSLFTIIIFSALLYIYNNHNKVENLIINSIKNFSYSYNYNFQFYEIYGLNRIKKKEISDIVQPYIDSSIFLLPLDKISNSILENNWVNTLELKTNYKNKLFITVEEYQPIGIYHFNSNKYYFNSKGKIIDYIDITDENIKFIIFTGKSSTSKASKLLTVIDTLKSEFRKEIIQAKFIENRRWDLLLEGNVLIKLSEDNLQKSIENFFKLTNNLSRNDFIDIKIIDLRDLQKAIIEYK